MQMLEVDEYYEMHLRGKTEEKILKEIQDLKKSIPYWREKWLVAAEEDYKARQENARHNPIKRLINWYRYKVKNLAPEADEIFDARTEWAYKCLYLEWAEQALADMRAMKASVPTHQIVIVKVVD